MGVERMVVRSTHHSSMAVEWMGVSKGGSGSGVVSSDRRSDIGSVLRWSSSRSLLSGLESSPATTATHASTKTTTAALAPRVSTKSVSRRSSHIGINGSAIVGNIVGCFIGTRDAIGGSLLLFLRTRLSAGRNALSGIIVCLLVGEICVVAHAGQPAFSARTREGQVKGQDGAFGSQSQCLLEFVVRTNGDGISFRITICKAGRSCAQWSLETKCADNPVREGLKSQGGLLESRSLSLTTVGDFDRNHSFFFDSHSLSVAINLRSSG